MNFAKIPIAFYQNVWKKSNIMYITYIVIGCVLIEVVYGSVTTAVWDSYNQGVCTILFFEIPPIYLFPLMYHYCRRVLTVHI